MTTDQETAIRAVLAAAPDGALRRVLRQPLRLWKAGGGISHSGSRCLANTLNAVTRRGVIAPTGIPLDVQGDAATAFDAACATDGLKEVVRSVKARARNILAERS